MLEVEEVLERGAEEIDDHGIVIWSPDQRKAKHPQLEYECKVFNVDFFIVGLQICERMKGDRYRTREYLLVNEYDLAAGDVALLLLLREGPFIAYGSVSWENGGD